MLCSWAAPLASAWQLAAACMEAAGRMTTSGETMTAGTTTGAGGRLPAASDAAAAFLDFCTHMFSFSRDCLGAEQQERKEKFTLFSDHNGSLLERQPGASRSARNCSNCWLACLSWCVCSHEKGDLAFCHWPSRCIYCALSACSMDVDCSLSGCQFDDLLSIAH